MSRRLEPRCFRFWCSTCQHGIEVPAERDVGEEAGWWPVIDTVICQCGAELVECEAGWQ